MTEGLYRKSETGVTSEPMKETGIYLPGSTGNAYVNALYMKDEVDTNIDQLTNDDENENYLDNKSEHAGEEQVDIGLKDLPLTGAPNIYVGKRNFIHQLMDVALLMANVSQLKALLSIDSSDKYFYPLLVFIILSISFQVVFTVTMLLIWSIEKGLEERTAKAQTTSDRGSIVIDSELKEIDEKKKVLADRLDKAGNILVLSIIVSNVFITGFGVEPHGSVVFTITMLLIWSIERGLEERTTKAQTTSDRGSIVIDSELKENDEKKKVLADRLDKVGNILA